MNPLDAAVEQYRSGLVARIGGVAAKDAAEEMRAHLLAETTARMELGDSYEQAVDSALASWGDLQRVVAAEPVQKRNYALIAAPALFTAFWFLPQTVVIVNPSQSLGPAYAMALPWVAAVLLGSVGRGGFDWRTVLKGGTVAFLAFFSIMLPEIVTGHRRSPDVSALTLAQIYAFVTLPTLVLHLLFAGATKLVRRSRMVRA